MKIPTYLISLALVTAGFAEDPSLKKALTEAIHVEEVERDLMSAASRYAGIVQSFRAENGPTEQREHAAAALFRLAEIRREQGSDEEAKKHYEAYLESFPEIEPQSRLARERLGLVGPAPRQKLTELGDDVEDPQLSENVHRTRWNFKSRLKPDELLLTTFEVEHHEDYANEGLPPEFEARTLHHAPSGKITKWFSRTQVNWSKEMMKKKYEDSKEKGFHEWHGYDRQNYISAFGQTYTVPEDINYSGGGWGDTSMAFFFTNEYSIKDLGEGGDYEEVKATKWLTVRLKTRLVSIDQARKLLTPLKMDLPEMGDEAWSHTLPPFPAELEEQNP